MCSEIIELLNAICWMNEKICEIHREINVCKKKKIFDIPGIFATLLFAPTEELYPRLCSIVLFITSAMKFLRMLLMCSWIHLCYLLQCSYIYIARSTPIFSIYQIWCDCVFECLYRSGHSTAWSVQIVHLI